MSETTRILHELSRAKAGLLDALVSAGTETPCGQCGGTGEVMLESSIKGQLTTPCSYCRKVSAGAEE